MLARFHKRFKCVRATQAVQMCTDGVQMFTHAIQMSAHTDDLRGMRADKRAADCPGYVRYCCRTRLPWPGLDLTTS